MYEELFKYLNQEFDILPLDTDMQEIIRIVYEHPEWRTLHYNLKETEEKK